MSSYLSGQGDPNNWGSQIPSVPDKIHNEDIYFIEVIGQNANGGDTSSQDVQNWARDYPDPKVPIFVDPQQQFSQGKYVTAAWPTVMAINNDMKIGLYPGSNNPYEALYLVENYEPPEE